MPAFAIPDGGMDLYYIDESAGDGIFVMATLRVPFIRDDQEDVALMVWPRYYEAATEWRRRLSTNYNIRFRAELHGTELLNGQGRLHKTSRSLTKEESVAVYAGALESLSFLQDESVLVAAATDATDLFGQSKMVAALTGLLQRIQRHANDRTCGMIFFDEGHREYFHAFRKAQKYLPIGSALGGWPEGRTRNRPMKLFVEDGNPKSSKTSYLIQIVDLVAYAALQKLKAESGKLPQKRLTLGHHELFDSIPVLKRNKRVQPRRGDGIAII